MHGDHADVSMARRLLHVFCTVFVGQQPLLALALQIDMQRAKPVVAAGIDGKFLWLPAGSRLVVCVWHLIIPLMLDSAILTRSIACAQGDIQLRFTARLYKIAPIFAYSAIR